MVPDESGTASTATPDDDEIVYRLGGFATIDPTDVSTASPTIIYDNSPREPIDFDNRHERRKKAALARKKRKGKNEDYRLYWKGRKR